MTRTIALVAGAAVLLAACSEEWPAHRFSLLRNAEQPHASGLSDPRRVPSLYEEWRWHPALVGDADQVTIGAWGPIGFSASPIVDNHKVFVAHLNGHLYALNLAGAMLWKYPPAGSPALRQPTICNPSSPGIASTPIIANVRGRSAVIFGAPDPSAGGDGRLWAVDTSTGSLIWRSAVVAHLSNNEQIGYDSPVVFGDRVYVGVSDHCDSPIIAGKLFAIDLNTGALSAGFAPFVASAVRGGGIWSSPAATIDGDVIITTGNGCTSFDGGCSAEPSPNHGLSMIKVDGATGAVIWKFQPVPWSMDLDPDWAAIPAVHYATCGAMAVAPMKDGYTHAINLGPPAPAGDPVALGLSLRRWSFPPATIPFTSGSHGDTRYIRAPALWKDVVIAVTGGLDVTVNVAAGYSRLYALNACAPDRERIRWWAQFSGSGWPTMGHPSVTRGIVYVGTSAATLYALADPDVAPAAGSHCEYPGVAVANCVSSGFRLVPIPAVLASVPLSGSIRTSPAIARGHVYVTTDAGYVHSLTVH